MARIGFSALAVTPPMYPRDGALHLPIKRADAASKTEYSLYAPQLAIVSVRDTVYLVERTRSS
jgi:hypothetical protein